MQCDRCRSWVSLELDSALSEFETALLRRHLRSCADCTSFAVGVRTATDLLRSASLEEVPMAIELPRRRSALLIVPRAAALAAAAAAVAVIALGGIGNSARHLPAGIDANAGPNSDIQAMVSVRRQQLPQRSSRTHLRIRVIEVD